MKSRYLSVLLILLAVPLLALSQPSSSISVNFRFYNKSKEVSKEDFDKKYKFLNDTWARNTPLSYRYDDKNKTYTVSGGVVYNDLKLKIASSKDTMQLVFKTKGGTRENFKLGRIDFKEDTFIIDNDVVAALDLKDSKSNYYNYLIAQLSEDKSNIPEPIETELNRLKLKYAIAESDFNPKKEKELIEIASLRDSLIIQKYTDMFFTNLGDSTANERFQMEKLSYPPDKKFKIFVFRGESCGGNCTNYYQSYIHYNLDKKVPTAEIADFYPIDSIIKIDDNNYLALQHGVEGAGIYVYEHKIATLIHIKDNKLSIGRNFIFPYNSGTDDVKGIDIGRNALNDGNDDDFYLKYDSKTNVLEYRFWKFYKDNDETSQKRIQYGKLIFSKDHFRFLSSSQGQWSK
jgi:hypothetical protein